MKLTTRRRRGTRFHKAQTLYVAISGGHTFSLAIAFTEEEGILASVVSEKSLNPHFVEFGVLVSNLQWVVDELDASIPDRFLYRATKLVVAAIAGGASDFDQAFISSAIRRVFIEKPLAEIKVIDDTWAGLIAGACSLRGTCAFAGTGASVYVGTGRTPKGWLGKVDGWGPFIGDFGSGFQLAIDMFRAFCRLASEGKPEPPLFRRVQEIVRQNKSEYYGTLKAFRTTQNWFDVLRSSLTKDRWRVPFSKLAAAATNAADETPGDELAKKLVRKAADEMLTSLRIAFARNREALKLPIVLQGGMFEYSALYRNRVRSSLRRLTQVPIELARFRPILGAALFALQKPRTKLLNVATRLEHSVRRLDLAQQNVLLRLRDSGFASME